MTAISGTGEQSAGNVWLADQIAKGRKSETAPAAAPLENDAAAPRPAVSGDVVVSLSSEAKDRLSAELATPAKASPPKEAIAESGSSSTSATGKAIPSADGDVAVIDLRREAQAWVDLNLKAVRNKEQVDLAKWDNSLTLEGINSPAGLYTRFGQASAAEKEAYIQRQLIRSDASQARMAIMRQYEYATANNIPVASVNPADVPKGSFYSREAIEFGLRHSTMRWAAGPWTARSASQPAPATPAAPVQKRKFETEQEVADWIHNKVRTMRQKMGVDADTSYQTTYNTGPLITAEMSASAQQGIRDAQAAYDRILAVRLDIEAKGGKWVAAAQVRDNSADSGSSGRADPMRAMESREMYLPNIADLPLALARKSLSFAEYVLSSNAYDGININAHYGDQAISDMNTYVVAVKEHIAKLENGDLPRSFEEQMKAVVRSLEKNGSPQWFVDRIKASLATKQ